jgi:hypothetical protein
MKSTDFSNPTVSFEPGARSPELITHLHPVPRSGMLELYLQTPYAFMA